jgi:hypothetical protein
MKKAHEQKSPQVQPNHRHSLRDGVNGFLRALLGEPGFFATIVCGSSRQLDASVGASGPHDFAVRGMVVRLSTWPRPSHPASRFVTIAHTPLLPRQDGRIDKPVSTEPRSEKFSLMGWTDVERLDTQKH